jgi:bifunctional N-acetylglucosamine-1-phosphate-uridyltransferase/glucosamine-1-phosphate-acetyltransferase GlmU-like protein
MIKGALRLLYRLCMLSKQNRNKVFVDPTARFNRNTFFEGCNKVKQKASLCDSTVGKYTYIGAFSDLSSCRIGAFSSISHDVYVEPYTHPSKGFISTSPVFLVHLNRP